VRDLGIVPGRLAPGTHNAIVDVPGIRVGHTTLDDGSGVRTGVTAVVPDAVDRAAGHLPAGLFVGNGYGKLVGATQLVELGVVETPVVLTGTLSAFRVADALVSYMLALPGNEEMVSVNPVVGETNDGFLSDIRLRPITEKHVLDALTTADDGKVEEGCVGAGTGTAALGFKAGIGTSSRLVDLAAHGHCTVGALVQSNFSGTLTVCGIPIPQEAALESHTSGPEPGGNSCMIVVAVDAGLDARQLGRVARRAVFAMARVGADFAHGSGDYAIALSTAGSTPGSTGFPDSALDPVFAAVQEAVEEALLNSLFTARTTVGHRGHVRQAVPHGLVLQRLRDAGVIDG